jgi:hypothetical protein
MDNDGTLYMKMKRGQLYGATGLRMTEQLLLVISHDEVMNYSYMNTAEVE